MSTADSWAQRIWSTFLSFFAARAEAEVTPSSIPTLPAIKLSGLVQLLTCRPHSQKTFYIMMDTVNEDGFTFKTQNPLKEGETLEIGALLRGVGQVKLTGKVEWLLAGSTVYSGQFKLTVDGDERQNWLRFVSLQRKGQRGATY